MRYSSLIAIGVACVTPVVAENWQDNCDFPMNEGYSYSFLDNCESHYFAGVDYLAWYVDQEGMSYASVYDIANTAATSTANAADGKDLFFKTKWDSGVRAMAGFKPCNKSWDIRSSYTYFSTNDKPRALSSSATSISTTPPEGGSIVATSGTVIIPAYFSVREPAAGFASDEAIITYSILPRWKFNFNQADLELSEEFFVTCDATIRFFGGFRGLWTNQKFEEVIALESTFLSDGITTTFGSSAAFEAQHKFSAFGARAGFDFNYTVGGGLDLYASCAGSILWGWFNDRQSYAVTTAISGSTGTEDAAETFTHSHHTSILNLDTAFGLRWNYWLNCNRHLLTVRFGWEQHIYLNINQFQNFANTPLVGAIGPGSILLGGTQQPFADHNVQRGDLSLSGFVVGLQYAF